MRYFSRRSLIVGLIGVVVTDRLYAVPAGIGERPVRSLPSDTILRLDEVIKGINPPTAGELTTANKVIERSPKAVNPFKVAQYFERLGRGEENPSGEDWSAYAREWPDRYNPVIVRFFEAISTVSASGDCTKWCSAFVNWCIKRGREGRPDANTLTDYTHDALAASFQKFGTRTDDPKPGDVAVFKHHVGFFSRPSSHKQKIWIIGGNQAAPPLEEPTSCPGNMASSAGGQVSEIETEIGSASSFLSFRTDASLHDLA